MESEDFLGFRLHPINCSSSKNQLRLQTPTPHFFKTDSDSSIFDNQTPTPAFLITWLQLKTCDSRFWLHNPGWSVSLFWSVASSVVSCFFRAAEAYNRWGWAVRSSVEPVNIAPVSEWAALYVSSCWQMASRVLSERIHANVSWVWKSLRILER